MADYELRIQPVNGSDHCRWSVTVVRVCESPANGSAILPMERLFDSVDAASEYAQVWMALQSKPVRVRVIRQSGPRGSERAAKSDV